MNMDALITYAGILIGMGSVYGLIRSDLKHLHEKAVKQEKTNDRLHELDRETNKRINDHIEHHHLRKQNG